MNGMQVLFFDCGQGDMSLVKFPTGKTMLIDICLSGPEDNNLNIIKEKLGINDNGIKILDYLVITHPHNDHIKNIKLLPDNGIIINNIWESGHRLYVTKEDREDGNYKDYDDMLHIINNLKARDLSKYKDLESNIEPIVDNANFGEGVEIYVLAPTGNISDEKKTKEEQEKLIHKHCAVIKIQYKSNSILFTGDSSYGEWRDRIINEFGNLVESTVLHVSHHGSYTFFTDETDLTEDEFNIEHLKKIRATVFVISVGKNKFNHPNTKALELYSLVASSHDSIYSTKDMGTIEVMLFSNNEWYICPTKFEKETTSEFFEISIKVDKGIPDGQNYYDKGVKLRFFVDIKGDCKQIKRIVWQVQNNGQGEEKGDNNIKDKYHHELYYGYDYLDKIEFERDTYYNGTHFIRCTVYDTQGKYSTDAMQIPVKKYKD